MTRSLKSLPKKADEIALRLAYANVIEKLLELGDVLDDMGLPSMTVDNIRREFCSMKVAAMQRLATTNDNATNQSGEM